MSEVESPADVRHDVALIALAMFGATAGLAGLPQQAVDLGGALPFLAVAAAVIAAHVIAVVERDVTASEAGVAAAIAIPIAVGLDWSRLRWASPGSAVLAIASVAGAAACTLVVLAFRREPSRMYRVLFAACAAGGVLAIFAIGGLALYRAIGTKLDGVPHVMAACSGALLAWRAPQISRGETAAGAAIATFGAGLSMIPSGNPEIPVAAVLLVIGLITAIASGIAAAAYHVTGRWLARRANRGGVPTARARDEA